MSIHFGQFKKCYLDTITHHDNDDNRTDRCCGGRPNGTPFLSNFGFGFAIWLCYAMLLLLPALGPVTTGHTSLPIVFEIRWSAVSAASVLVPVREPSSLILNGDGESAIEKKSASCTLLKTRRPVATAHSPLLLLFNDFHSYNMLSDRTYMILIFFLVCCAQTSFLVVYATSKPLGPCQTPRKPTLLHMSTISSGRRLIFTRLTGIQNERSGSSCDCRVDISEVRSYVSRFWVQRLVEGLPVTVLLEGHRMW
ncbi:uncharacterized protein MYCFIDRAFT_206959 [Pseudocercospora fijiensis CIRAD86]|uniref:Uncharacterized protein n=1 Tax=Pseudocercospora fijiensis (strain CIRAD86) TaxID=383855 RepID=M3A6W2_PSEFD|nr:uncharacterized protein MYCFIDRAFT_206959 [Pseudocercospora fijiensis CIRAD86]EME86829.1 hypothetical protein MYCFIDRAFT_206959 [Pseudocercospora fijiensis CIRAD86]